MKMSTIRNGESSGCGHRRPCQRQSGHARFLLNSPSTRAIRPWESDLESDFYMLSSIMFVKISNISFCAEDPGP